MDQQERREEAIITISDFVSFLKNHAKPIFRWSALVGLCFLIFSLFFPLQYTYQVRVKVPEHKMGGEGALKEMIPFMGQSSPREGVIALLRSHVLLRSVIEKMGLQVECSHLSGWERLFFAFKENLLFGIFRESFFDQNTFSFRDVVFTGERPLVLRLNFISPDEYEVMDLSGEFIARAQVGAPVQFAEGRFTLEMLPSEIEWGKHYPCKFLPLSEVISDWQNKSEIRGAKLEKNILDFRMKDMDRHRPKRFLDLLMNEYQLWKQKEQNDLYAKQLAYLQEKTSEITESFRQELADHRGYLQESLAKYGTFGYTEEIESLMKSKHIYKAQLLEIALDLKRAEEMEKDDATKKEGLALQTPMQEEKGIYRERLKNWEFAKPMLPKTDSSVAIGISLSPYAHQTSSIPLEASSLSEQKESIKFNSKIVSDCLANCVREQERIEEEREKLSLLLQGMESSEFEISSLGSVFGDQAVQNLLMKVQSVSLQLKDKENLSLREQERLEELTANYKSSLAQQLVQAISLRQGQLDVLKNKILQWRSVWKEVLTSEKRLLQEQLAEINQSMNALPDKWYYETLLNMRQEQCKEALKGVEQLRFALNASLHPLIYQLQVLDGDFVSNKTSSSRFWYQGARAFILTWFVLYFCAFIRKIFTTPQINRYEVS